jgi:hypothetical protein
VNILIKYGLFIIAFLFSCNNSSDKPTADKIIHTYIVALNESNFKQIESCISDSLVTMEGGFVLTKSSKDYYVHFQWDSVFSPKYTILNSNKISDKSIEVTLSKICKRIKYLHDSATVFKTKFDFADKRIVSIDNFELVYFDTLKWSSRRDTLVNWVSEHYPELDGFIYDQTPNGAQNYLKAIELYTDKK